MKRPFLTACAVAALALPTLTTLTSCDEESLNRFLYGDPSDRCGLSSGLNDLLQLATGLDCNKKQQEYDNYVADMGSLLSLDRVQQMMDQQPEDMSMAMTLNASAINKLFRAATTWDFGGTVVEFPTIQVGGCRNISGTSGFADRCLRFVFGATLGGDGVQIELGVPITTDIKGDDPSDAEDYAKGLRTAIFADIRNSQLITIKLKSGGTVSELDPIASVAITALYKSLIAPKLKKRIGLFDVSAWEFDFNNNPIKLLAGAPVVNDAEGTLTLGMFSNINLGTTFFGENGRVTWDEEFPKDAEIGLHIHPDLIRGIMGLMFHDGHVESNFSSNTSSNQSTTTQSAFKISMASFHDYPMQTLMECGDNWRDYFSLGLRFWSLQDICGYADLIVGFNLKASESKFEMSLGNVQFGKAEGIGAAVKMAADQFTNSQTFKDILKYASFSFNYDQFKVPTQKDNEDAATTKAAVRPTDKVNFNINGNGISLYLNFVDL